MNLRRIFITFAVISEWRLTESTSASFGLIRNASLTIAQGNTTIIRGTCATCLCALIADPLLFSLNCFPNNLTCEMHSKMDQDKPFTLMDSTMKRILFHLLAHTGSGISVDIRLDIPRPFGNI